MVVCSIEESKGLSLSVEELTSSLLTHDRRINRSIDSLESAFQCHSFIIRGRGRRNINKVKGGRGVSQVGYMSTS